MKKEYQTHVAGVEIVDHDDSENISTVSTNVFVNAKHPIQKLALLYTYDRLVGSVYEMLIKILDSTNINEEISDTKGDIACKMITTILDEYGDTELALTIKNLAKGL